MRRNSSDITPLVWRFSGLALTLFLCGCTPKSIRECDLLAASPLDTTKPADVPGVAFKDVDAVKAIAACGSAAKAEPNNARVLFQYGRSLHGRAEAMDVYKKAAGLGSALAMNNIGALLEEKKMINEALDWYERAGQAGNKVGIENAANLLEIHSDRSGAAFLRLAGYWRRLADEGDAIASEKLGKAIHEKTVSPRTSNEALDRLAFAAKEGRQIAAQIYSSMLKSAPATPENARVGAKYALQAYRQALAAPANSEEAYPINPYIAFNNYAHFVKAGAENVLPTLEYESMSRDTYLGEKLTTLTVTADCRGTKVPFNFFIWDWTKPYPQTDLQAKWLNDARGCTVPQETLSSFRKIFDIAAENKVSYSQLLVYALKHRDDPPTNAQTQRSDSPNSLPTTVAQSEVKTSLTEEQKVALGLTAVAAGVACFIWSETCKDLAWEAAKGVANQAGRETVRRSP